MSRGARTLRAERVVTPAEVLEPGEVVVEDRRITAVRSVAGPAPERVLAPGFVDLQVNGHGDVAVASAEGEDWERLDGLLLEQGVTAWCPTLTSRPLDAYGGPLARIRAAADRGGIRPLVAGAHLEGPFLAPGHAGAHPAEQLSPVDRSWLAELPGIVRVVTLAPELPSALDAIGDLADRHVLVALGHSGADRAAAETAIERGARLVTHLFNAMAPFHHRRPGLVGAGLADRRVAVSLIADLVHVDAAALSLAFAAKGRGGVALVTDAVAWRGEGPGGHPLELDEEGAPRTPDGVLAGSALTMDGALRAVTSRCGVALDEAVHAAATAPADLLGLREHGRIEPGSRADLVALDRHLHVEAVWLEGSLVHGTG